MQKYSFSHKKTLLLQKINKKYAIMIQSMTGYGKTVVTFNEKKINVEIKSLNSKALDLSTRIAPLFREKEMEIRQMIAQALLRGKVDFSLWVEKEAATEANPINKLLVKNYYEQIEALAKNEQLPLPADPMGAILRFPDVFQKTETEELSDEEWLLVRQAIADAIAKLVDFRTQEGAALQQKFTEKIDNIAALLASIEPFEKSRVEKIRARYTVDDELALLRQRDVKPDEFAEYNAYCEACKAEARAETEGV